MGFYLNKVLLAYLLLYKMSDIIEELLADGNRTKEDQKQTAESRMKFLKTLFYLKGKHGQISMFNNTKVSGKLEAFDHCMHHVVMTDVTTPVTEYTSNMLRSTDIISITCDPPNLKLKSTET